MSYDRMLPLLDMALMRVWTNWWNWRGDDALFAWVGSVVHNVDHIFDALLIEHIGKGDVAVLVGEVQGGHCPVIVDAELDGLHHRRDGLVALESLAGHCTADELVQLLGVSLDGLLVGIVTTGVGHSVLQLGGTFPQSDTVSEVVRSSIRVKTPSLRLLPAMMAVKASAIFMLPSENCGNWACPLGRVLQHTAQTQHGAAVVDEGEIQACRMDDSGILANGEMDGSSVASQALLSHRRGRKAGDGAADVEGIVHKADMGQASSHTNSFLKEPLNTSVQTLSSLTEMPKAKSVGIECLQPIHRC